MDKGTLVPDNLLFGMIANTISKPNCGKVMFDGFPRTLEQAKELDSMLESKGKKLVAAIYLDVPDSALIERGTGRRIHQPSGRSYHIKFKPPKVEGKDDQTGEPLIQRDDDKEETIKKRLETFHENNNKILDYYENKKVVYRIKADNEINLIWNDVKKVLDGIINDSPVLEPKAESEVKDRDQEIKPEEKNIPEQESKPEVKKEVKKEEKKEAKKEDRKSVV